jgi:membrane fusion protein
MKLYREEAVHHATRRLAGEVVLATPVSTRVLGGIAVSVVVGVAIFASTATYARRETVAGWVVPENGMIRVEAPQGGRILSLAVGEGDTVAEGGPIAVLKLSASTAKGDAGARMAADLNQEGEAARLRADAQLKRLELEGAQLRDRQSAIADQRREVQRRIGLARDRARLAANDVERARGLVAKGFLPQHDLDARIQAASTANDYTSQLESQDLALSREAADVGARLKAIPVDIETARADATSASATLGQRKTEMDTQDAYSVVAPIDGTVAALPPARGQMVASGGTVAVITPKNSPLVIEMFVPSRAAGFIKIGQEVRVFYDAFPYQKFGSSAGRIVAVSRTVLAPTEVDVPGLVLREPVFRVRVMLARQSVNAYGEAIPLRPGMTASADIILARRTLFEWLLDPIFAAGRRG